MSPWFVGAVLNTGVSAVPALAIEANTRSLSLSKDPFVFLLYLMLFLCLSLYKVPIEMQCKRYVNDRKPQ